MIIDCIDGRDYALHYILVNLLRIDSVNSPNENNNSVNGNGIGIGSGEM